MFAAGIPAAAAGWHQLPPSLLKNGKKKKSFATVLIDKYPVNTFNLFQALISSKLANCQFPLDLPRFESPNQPHAPKTYHFSMHIPFYTKYRRFWWMLVCVEMMFSEPT